MKIASIDLGTNTALLLIGEATQQSYQFLHQERIYISLGKDSLQQKSLSPAAQQSALAAMVSFKKRIDVYGVVHIQAVATSALRSANNAAALIQKIKQKTGIAISNYFWATRSSPDLQRRKKSRQYTSWACPHHGHRRRQC